MCLLSKSLETCEASEALRHAARNTWLKFILSARVEQHSQEARALKSKSVRREEEVILREDAPDGGKQQSGCIR